MCVVSFEYTKRGQRLGIDEGITLTDETSICCLRALCEGLAPGDRVLGYTERRLRQAWSHVSACLGLATLGRKPYCLRRGGATHLYRVTGNLHVVETHGRWTSLSTTRRYISNATASLTQISLTETQVCQFQILSAEFRTFLMKYR